MAVYAVDLRGRGNSDGERFYVEAFEDYVRDVEAVMIYMLRVRKPSEDSVILLEERIALADIDYPIPTIWLMAID